MVEAPAFRRRDRPRVAPELLAVLAALILAEALLLGTYVATTSARITDPIVFVYPFVWIDASVLAVLAFDGPDGTRRQKAVAGVLGVGYFLVLAYFGGLVGPGSGGVPLHVNWGLPPGYGPAILANGDALQLIVEPYKVVGYLALTYFVYATVLDAVAGALSGLLGLFSCVSCTWPILGTIATSIFGSGSAVAAFALSQSYGLGTLVFLTALGLLYYRPLF